jgi:hypothetical protein
MRLVGAVLREQHEHWQLEGRRMFSVESMALIPELSDIPALLSGSASPGRCGLDRRPGTGCRNPQPPDFPDRHAHNTSATGRET